MVRVDYSDLEAAIEFASFDGFMEHAAYISLDTGRIFCISEDYRDEDAPDDIEESDRYIALPDRRELDLGQRLVFDFAAHEMPDFYDDVRDIFSRKGAYRRFERFLEEEEMLEEWYEFEADATKKALREWGRDNGFEVVEEKGKEKS